MMVETKVVGAQETEVVEIPVPADATTLRALLAILVRHELAGYRARRGASRTLQVLTPADLARGAADGSYGRERRATPEPPPEAEAVARAQEAYTDGLYFVFLDGVQVEALDEPLTVRPESSLRLVRLVALAGG
ncbi:hypothetical protein E8D34_01395 [Nocardioides sp. GY 10113]|uniref:hypothetical protein n=1 Tax=Nocardioides sp. GY 10113 TaxID=2569761 RepID=UPI0010A8CDEC|nr:hypothetical protein [Nocardioides sp. GY 10113]TIC89180.1 hypothetical protein E8D34_01395 [Nocardioides sp. GY 10113]